MMAGEWTLPCALAALGHFLLLGSITQPIQLLLTHSWGGPVQGQELDSMVVVEDPPSLLPPQDIPCFSDPGDAESSCSCRHWEHPVSSRG